MKTLFKQAMIAAALATAMSAVAQAPSSQSAPSGSNAYPPPPISNKDTTSGDARVPANRDSDAVKACANVAASDKEACIARENARLGTGKSMGGTKGGGNDAAGAQGSSTGSTSGGGTTGATGSSSGANGGTTSGNSGGTAGGAAGNSGASGASGSGNR